MNPPSIPPEEDFRIPTQNNCGYMFTKFDPVALGFLAFLERHPEAHVFEVGGAYGNVAEAALKKGALHYTLNDSDERHLQAFAQKLRTEGKADYFSSLSLVPGRCPDEVTLPSNHYDAILVNKVLHFFTPDTIDAFLVWLKQGLKKGGRAYIFTISPYSPKNAHALLDYEEKKKRGDRFPGYCPNYSTTAPAQRYSEKERPKSLLFMDLETLKALFLHHGFTIEETFECGILDAKHPEWGPGKDLVGLIAIK